MLACGVAATLRRTLANATRLDASLVVVTAIVHGPTGVVTAVAASHPVNTGVRLRALSAAGAAGALRAPAGGRVLFDASGTTVVTELRAPSTASTAADLAALVAVAAAIQSGSMPAATAVFSAVSAAWGAEMGASPVALGVELAAAPAPAPAPSGDAAIATLSSGAIAGIAVAGVVAAAALALVIKARMRAASRAVAAQAGGGGAHADAKPVRSAPDAALAAPNPLHATPGKAGRPGGRAGYAPASVAPPA